jgi:hypothetical protein
MKVGFSACLPICRYRYLPRQGATRTDRWGVEPIVIKSDACFNVDMRVEGRSEFRRWVVWQKDNREMTGHQSLARRSLSWRLTSSLVTGLAGAVSRGFLYGLNNVETPGLDQFLNLLDERLSGHNKEGLLTGMLLHKGHVRSR